MKRRMSLTVLEGLAASAPVSRADIELPPPSGPVRSKGGSKALPPKANSSSSIPAGPDYFTQVLGSSHQRSFMCVLTRWPGEFDSLPLALLF